jgi:hypothetical protein
VLLNALAALAQRIVGQVRSLPSKKPMNPLMFSDRWSRRYSDLQF